MEAEIPPGSHDQDEIEHELSLCETIAAVIQALEQVEMVGTQLFQALERLVTEGKTIDTRMKQQRNVPRSMKQSKKELLIWFGGFGGDVEEYQNWCAWYRTDLEKQQEICSEKLSAFKQLQEYTNNLPPQ